jgi:hypothetical protein
MPLHAPGLAGTSGSLGESIIVKAFRASRSLVHEIMICLGISGRSIAYTVA